MTSETPKLLVFPGIDGAPELRQGLVECLGRRVEVRTFALPEDTSLDHEGLAARFAAHLPDEPVVLAGESFSGPLVAMIAEKRPDVVKGVVFVASFPRLTYLRAAKLLLPFIPLRAIPFALIGFAIMGRRGSGDIPRRTQAALKRLPARLIKHRAKLTLEVDVSETISRLSQPILVIHGRNDRFVPQGHVRHFLRLRPDTQVVMIDGAHMILETHPAQVAEAIEAFIERISSCS